MSAKNVNLLPEKFENERDESWRFGGLSFEIPFDCISLQTQKGFVERHFNFLSRIDRQFFLNPEIGINSWKMYLSNEIKDMFSKKVFGFLCFTRD